MPSFEFKPNAVPPDETHAVYDKTTAEKIIALAGRLQDQHRDSMTAQQIESIGSEVGLEPAFVRQAMSHIESSEPRPVSAWPASLTTANPALVACLVSSAGLALLALLLPGQEFAALRQTALLTVAAIQGFLLNDKKQGFVAGVMTTAAMRLAATLGASIGLGADAHLTASTSPVAFLVTTALVGSVAGATGLLGAIMRRPFLTEQQRQSQDAKAQEQAQTASQNVTRAELLDALFTLQGQLQEQMHSRTFLSIDVVGSSQHKRQSPALAVEYSFGQFRNWAEAIIAAQNGVVHSAAGDGMMAMFEEDVSALRAARALQTQIAAFNTQYNRLPGPIAIRCGLSAGEVPIETGKPIGEMQSPVVDRAANLQKRAGAGAIVLGAELTAPALTELGALTPMPDADGETVFGWEPKGPGALFVASSARSIETMVSTNQSS